MLEASNFRVETALPEHYCPECFKLAGGEIATYDEPDPFRRDHAPVPHRRLAATIRLTDMNVLYSPRRVLWAAEAHCTVRDGFEGLFASSKLSGLRHEPAGGLRHLLVTNRDRQRYVQAALCALTPGNYELTVTPAQDVLAGLVQSHEGEVQAAQDRENARKQAEAERLQKELDKQRWAEADAKRAVQIADVINEKFGAAVVRVQRGSAFYGGEMCSHLVLDRHAAIRATVHVGGGALPYVALHETSEGHISVYAAPLTFVFHVDEPDVDVHLRDLFAELISCSGQLFMPTPANMRLGSVLLVKRALRSAERVQRGEMEDFVRPRVERLHAIKAAVYELTTGDPERDKLGREAQSLIDELREAVALDIEVNVAGRGMSARHAVHSGKLGRYPEIVLTGVWPE